MKIFKKNFLEIPSFTAGDATVLREVLHPLRESGLDLPYSLAYAELPPGASSLPHRLDRRSEVYILLEGEGTAFLEDQAFPLQAGDVLVIPPGTIQYLRNDGATPIRFWCIVAPPWTDESEEVF